MKSFERWREPGEWHTKGDDARDQEELWDHVGRGISQWQVSGSESGKLVPLPIKEKENEKRCYKFVSQFKRPFNTATIFITSINLTGTQNFSPPFDQNRVTYVNISTCN